MSTVNPWTIAGAIAGWTVVVLVTFLGLLILWALAKTVRDGMREAREKRLRARSFKTVKIMRGDE
jgi:hypothetical protein